MPLWLPLSHSKRQPLVSFAAIKRGFGERLKKGRELLGYTQKVFSEMTEIPLATLKDYEGGKSIPGGEAVAKIGFIGINLEWLFFDEGTPLSKEGRAPPLVAEQPRAGYVYLPLYEVRGGAAPPAGAPTVADENVTNELAFEENWIRYTLHAKPGELVLAHVEGDSGEPDLRSGDIVLINRSDQSARSDAIYMIRMDDALLYKQLQRLPGGKLRVSSRNPAYEPFTIEARQLNSPETFAIIGRVVWGCRRL